MKKIKKIMGVMCKMIAYIILFGIGYYIYAMSVYKITRPFSPLRDDFYKDNDIMTYYVNSPLKDEYGEINITDKTADLQYFFDVLKSSCASLPYMEKQYGFSASEMRNEYFSIIEKTSSDYEYIGTLISMINNLPSGHIGTLDPNYDRYFEEYLLGYEHIGLYINLDGDCVRMCNSWDKLLTEKGKEYSADKSILINRQSADSFGYYIYENNEIVTSEIESVISYDGMSYDEFTLKNLTSQKPEFDRNENKLIKRQHNLYFEPSETSRPVAVRILMKDGTEQETTMYNDYCRDVAIHHYRNSKEYLSESNAHDTVNPYMLIYSYDDKENNTGYISVNHFHMSYDGLWSEAVDNISSENLILDLRNCAGGQEGFFTDYMYPVLSGEDLTVMLTSYVPITEENCKVNFYTRKLDILRAKLFAKELHEPFMESEYKFFRQTQRMELAGGETKFKKIYILTGDGTFSCGDRLTYAMKNLDNVTVIGSNTAGDGIGTGSLCSSLVFREYMSAQIMPESKLIFSYTPQISLNEKGEINEIFGTPPDIYAENDDESVKIFSEIAEETGDPYSPYSYESRRKWDKVMNTAVSLITGDELS